MANRAVSTVRDTSVRVPLYRVVHSGTGLGLAAAGALAAALMLFAIAIVLNWPDPTDKEIVQRWILQNNPRGAIQFVEWGPNGTLSSGAHKNFRASGMKVGKNDISVVRAVYDTSSSTVPLCMNGEIVYRDAVTRRQDMVHFIHEGKIVHSQRNPLGKKYLTP